MNSQNASILGVVLLLLGVLLINSSAFVIREGFQVVVTQFGRPVGEPLTEAGLHFKIPFIQEARFMDKRILTWDGDVNEIPTKDKKYILVDTTARWKIVSPVRFIESVQTENRARDRIDAILDSETRNVISSHNLVEAVRNTNNIIDQAEAYEKAAKESEMSDEFAAIIGEIEKIEVGREQLSAMIIEKARPAMEELGIELIDVQLRRVAFNKTVEKKVYERMVSEQMRIAERIRSFGRGEKAKIEGRINKDLVEIESVSYRKAQQIRGEGEAKSISIYAAALSKDPRFYEFVRTMEAYESSLADRADFILSTSSDFLKFLKENK